MKETFCNLKKVFAFGKQYRWIFALETILTIIQIFIGVVLPLVLAKQIVLFTSNGYEELLYMSLLVLGIAIINEINTALIAKTCYVFRRGTTKNIQIALGREILNICQSAIEKNGTGTFIERLNQDSDKMSEIFTKGVGYLSGIVVNIGIFIAVFIINKIVFLYYLFVALFLIFVYFIRTQKIGIQDIKLRFQKEKVSGLIGELVRGEKDIKMLSAKNTFINKLSSEIILKNDRYHTMRNVTVVYNTFIGISIQIFSFLLVLLLIFLIKKNAITASIAVALFTYKTNILSNFMEKVSLLLDEVKNFNISSHRVFAILDSHAFVRENFGQVNLTKIKGEFSFQHVSFSYGDFKVLKDLNFEVHAGETVAFVGKSGAGKSTIFNLLGKLYEPDKGKIFIDGKNIQTLTEDSIRGNITIISQNPYIFNMSIRDNFLLIKENVTEIEIVDALEKACLYDFVMSLPNGLDTIIGEGGTNLSGGQKQRLAIARAFVQNTKIILFDEATSALDNETQLNIQSAIDNLKNEYTVMIIAHRLSTIIHADRILVIDEGRVVAEGTHKELLQHSSIYKKLYETEIMDEKKT